MRIVVLIGPPLAGKGTQSAFLEREGYFHFSAGAELRRMAKQPGALGQEIARLIEAGNMVPEDIVNKLVETVIAEKRAAGVKGVVLDGFPRMQGQADFLDALVAKERIDLKVIELHAPIDELNRRREKRLNEALAAGQEPRADDKEDVFRHRMDVYRRETEPLSARYAGQGVFHRVGIRNAPEEVSTEIARILALQSHRKPSPGLRPF
jgi:adenylate kinase